MSAAANRSAGLFFNSRNFHIAPRNYCHQTIKEELANSAWNLTNNSGYIAPKMEENIRENTIAQNMQTPRFLLGNAANFKRSNEQYESPCLVLDAWAQTTLEDFGLIADDRERIDFLQKENDALRERVHMLEQELRVHSDLLNQIHATAALKTKPHESIDHISPTPPATPVINHVQHNQSLQRTSPNDLSAAHISYTGSLATTTTPTNPQVMNSMHTNGVCVPQSDSVKYTIVSNSNYTNCEKHGNQSQIEPIEIQLAEEDGALNLNCSADSDRLQICLGEQEANQTREAANFKREDIVEEHPLPPQSGILIKRRKLNSQSPEAHQFHEQPKQYFKATAQNHQVISSNQLTEPTPNTLRHLQDENVLVSIGPNNTRVPYKLYEGINWDNPSIATRKLLMAIFDRNTLATHSMTGKPSPAFKGQAKPQKQRLDPRVTEDIVFVVTRRCKVSDKEVRNAITTKCADENKMMKLQMNKKNSQRNNTTNKENQRYINQQHMQH